MKDLKSDWFSNVRNNVLYGLVVALTLISDAITGAISQRQLSLTR